MVSSRSAVGCFQGMYTGCLPGWCVARKEAEVLCHLYAQLGTDLLTKLKGDFAFVLYNAKLVRPLP